MTGRGWRRLVGTHLMNDESVVFALAQEDLPRKRAAYWACGARRADLLAGRRRSSVR